MLRFGNIDKVGDAGSDNENRYRVRLREQVNTDGSPLLTGWLFCLKRSALNDADDYIYDINEAVAIQVNDDLREGVILGAINTVNAKPKTTDPDIEQKTFKDGSVVSYDRKNHVYTISITGQGNKINITADDGEVNVNCKNATVTASDGMKIDAKLEVTKDVTFDGKLTVSGDISGSGKVKAATGVESQTDVTAGAGTISLLTHKHVSGAPGSPTGPSIP
jgi:phage baseplate assembly protein V